MNTTYIPQRRPSWLGIIAGLLMGLITAMTMGAIALILGSFLPYDLKGTSIGAGIYAAISALISAYVAGYFAVKCSAPETLFGDGTDIEPATASRTGMLTAAAIVFATTFFAMSGTAGVVAGAASLVGKTVSGAAGTVVQVGGVAAAGAASNDGIQREIKQAYRQVTGNLNKRDIEGWIAENTDGLNEQQVHAVANVAEDLVNEIKGDLQQQDFTDIDTWKNLDEYAKARLDQVQDALTGQEFVTRLQREGLSEQQARDVQNQIAGKYKEYRAKAEQAATEARQKIEQGLQAAEEAARKAALYAGIFWIISMLLTFGAAIAGAKSAASNYRLERPIYVRNETLR